MPTTNCSNIITSEDYFDILLKNRVNSIESSTLKEIPCTQNINEQWLVLHNPISESPPISLSTYGYTTIPKLYGLMDTSALDTSGITRVQNQPVLNLKGQGVILGFIDTGIDYTHESFKDTFGNTRILSIWDQTIEGTPPEGFLYGTEYSKDIIDEALALEDPFSLVPSRDTNGHGTFIAGVAGGSNTSPDFSGVAPASNIIMVKLKEAKQYLKDYYLVKENAIAYQENDIMLGIKYLYNAAIRYKMPLVICISVGSSATGHNGYSALEEYLDYIGTLDGFAVVAPTGNEGNERHHFLGYYPSGNNTVEIRCNENTSGVFLEMWVNYPDTYSIEIISPLGNKVPTGSFSRGYTREYSFILENTRVTIDYRLVEIISGQQVITIRLIDPTPGIWQINVTGDMVVNGTYNLWLPIAEFQTSDTFFIRSDPNVTLTAPSTARQIITVGGYNHNNESFYLNSGRGYTAQGTIKPDIVAPSVSIYGPRNNTNNQYSYRTGTSLAAALTAGTCALLMEWGLVQGNTSFMSSSDLKSYLIKGAQRNDNRTYPNPEWGYGTLNAYNIFEAID